MKTNEKAGIIISIVEMSIDLAIEMQGDRIVSKILGSLEEE